MAVRSARLFGPVEVAASAELAAYTCPAGATVIVKRFTACPGASTGGWEVYFGSSAFANRVRQGTSVAGNTTDLEVWWVLEPGDVLRVVAGPQGEQIFTGHGAILDGVA